MPATQSMQTSFVPSLTTAGSWLTLVLYFGSNVCRRQGPKHNYMPQQGAPRSPPNFKANPKAQLVLQWGTLTNEPLAKARDATRELIARATAVQHHRVESQSLCSENLTRLFPQIGWFFVGVLRTRALLFEVCTKAPDVWKLRNKTKYPRGLREESEANHRPLCNGSRFADCHSLG